MSQKELVLDHIQKHGHITSRTAYTELGVMQHPRRIFDLKREGHPIVARTAIVPNREGDPVRIAVYEMRQ